MKEIERAYNYGKSTIYDILELERETGSVKPRVGPCGRKPKLAPGEHPKVAAAIDERPDITLEELKESLSLPVSVSRLVFLDKSGVNTDMSRRYGRAKGKARVVDHVPLNTPRATTILSAVRLDGTTVHTAFEGAVNGERFKDYLRECLAPALHPGDLVVMDNLASHKVHGVADIIRKAKAIPVYLPPYSPDFNPIKQM